MYSESPPTQAQKSCYKVLLKETISSPTLEQIICVQHLTKHLTKLRNGTKISLS